MKEIIITDIEGTLVSETQIEDATDLELLSHKVMVLTSSTPYYQAPQRLSELNEKYRTVYLSGLPSSYEVKIKNWLFEFFPSGIVYLKENISEPPNFYKQRMLKYLKGKHKIKYFFDDNQLNIIEGRILNINSIRVVSNNFWIKMDKHIQNEIGRNSILSKLISQIENQLIEDREIFLYQLAHLVRMPGEADLTPYHKRLLEEALLILQRQNKIEIIPWRYTQKVKLKSPQQVPLI